MAQQCGCAGSQRTAYASGLAVEVGSIPLDGTLTLYNCMVFPQSYINIFSFLLPSQPNILSAVINYNGSKSPKHSESSPSICFGDWQVEKALWRSVDEHNRTQTYIAVTVGMAL